MLPSNNTTKHNPLIVPQLPVTADPNLFRTTLLAPLAVRLSSLFATVEELDFQPGDLEELVWTEAELESLGLSGFVDFATGSIVTQMADWHDFTARFMEFCELFHYDRNYCQLAVAIAKADGYAEAWDYYLSLARLFSHHYDEITDTRLLRKKASFELSGWVFTFSGSSWVAETPGIEIRGATLSATIENIVQVAIPYLAMWEERHLVRLATRDGKEVNGCSSL